MSPREATTVTSAVLRDWPLPAPGQDKESRGRTLIVGGTTQTPGAVMLAAEAALRSGAGKLQVATVEPLAAPLAIALPEALVRALPTTASGGLDPSAADAIVEMAQDCAAVLLGPGLLDADGAVALLEAVVPRLRTTVVLDALGLAFVGAHPDGLRHLGGRAVLSPNATELALTLGIDAEQVKHDQCGPTVRLAQRAGAVVVSGGPTSWVADPEDGLWRVEAGGPGLGVSGSGDVQAGIVTGLCARGAEPAQAAVWAAHLHGRAGDRLAASVGRVGFLARELPAQVPQVLAEIEV